MTRESKSASRKFESTVARDCTVCSVKRRPVTPSRIVSMTKPEFTLRKEKDVTDTHKVIYEAERRVKLLPKKDINKHKPGAHEI